MMTRPNIPESFLRLSSALAKHFLALFSLASFETQQLFKKIISSLILLSAIIVVLLIAYLGFLATLMSIAVCQLHLSWSLIFTILTLAHMIIAGILIMILMRRRSSPAFEMTIAEIERDLESLSSSTPSHHHENNF